MKVSVVIPSADRPHLAFRCALSCLKQDFWQNELEICLVLSKKLSYVSTLFQDLPPNLRLFFVDSENVSALRNYGARKSKGEIIYFLDDDCQLPSDDHIRKLYEAHIRLPEASGVGGGYLSIADASLWARAYNFVVNFWLVFYTRPSNQCSFLVGGNSSYKREVFHGGDSFSFNESLNFGGEESEFNSRLVNQGKVLWFDQRLSVFHASNPSFFDFIRKAWIQGKGKVHQTGIRTTNKRALTPLIKETSPFILAMIFFYWFIASTAHKYMAFKQLFSDASPLKLKQISSKSQEALLG